MSKRIASVVRVPDEEDVPPPQPFVVDEIPHPPADDTSDSVDASGDAPQDFSARAELADLREDSSSVKRILRVFLVFRITTISCPPQNTSL